MFRIKAYLFSVLIILYTLINSLTTHKLQIRWIFCQQINKSCIFDRIHRIKAKTAAYPKTRLNSDLSLPLHYKVRNYYDYCRRSAVSGSRNNFSNVRSSEAPVIELCVAAEYHVDILFTCYAFNSCESILVAVEYAVTDNFTCGRVCAELNSCAAV